MLMTHMMSEREPAPNSIMKGSDALLFHCTKEDRCMWQNMQTAVAFLCTRVQRPDKDDYKWCSTYNVQEKFTRRQESCRRHHQTIEWKIWERKPIHATWSKLIEYLKMTLDYTTKGTVENINVWINWESTQPTAIRHEWKCHNAGTQTPVQCEPRNKQCAQNNFAAIPYSRSKLLYISRCTWQDMQTAVAFLCSRVQTPDEDDYKNSLGWCSTYNVQEKLL